MRYGVWAKSNDKYLKYDDFEKTEKEARLFIEDCIFSDKDYSSPTVACRHDRMEWQYRFFKKDSEIGDVVECNVYAFFHDNKIAIDVICEIALKGKDIGQANVKEIKQIAHNYDMNALVGESRIVLRSELELVVLNEGLIDCICEEGALIYNREEQSDWEIGIEFMMDQLQGVLYVMEEQTTIIYNSDSEPFDDEESKSDKEEKVNESSKESSESIISEDIELAPDLEEEEQEGMTIGELKQIIKACNERVMGQEEYVETAAFCLYEGLNKNPKNLLVAGPTGSGKTYTIKTLIDLLKESGKNIGFIKEDVSNYTSNGFKGGDIEQIKKKIMGQMIFERDLIVVYLDEIDKLLIPEFDGAGMNVNSEIQGELLSLLTKDISNVEENVEALKQKVIFICTGAFVGLDEIKDKHRKTNEGLGFNREEVSKPTKITESIKLEQLLIEYGAIPEFIGRFNYFLEMNSLTKRDYWNIATDEEFGAIKETIDEYKKYGYDLRFRKNLIEEIVDCADKQPLGARYIKSAFNLAAKNSFLNRMKDNSVDITNDKLTVCKKDLG